MKTSTTLTLFVLSCMLLGACKSSESTMESAAPMIESAAPMSVEQELIESYLAALGGLETLRSIESMQLTGEVEMPSVGMTMPITITNKRPSMVHVRVEVSAMNAEVINAYDGETAWQINPMQGGTQKMTGEQARSIKEQADMDGLLIDYEAKGYVVHYVGEEEVNGSNTKKLRVMRPDSSEVFVYLDAESFLQVKTEAEGTNPMTGAKAMMEIFMMDYRDVDGMMVPFKMKVVMDGQIFQNITIKEVKTNVEVDDLIFMYPKK